MSTDQDTPSLEVRVSLLETRADVGDTHHEVLARQMADLSVQMREMHRDLRNDLVAAAEMRSKAAQELATHVAKEEARWQEAFVDGDPGTHRREHEQRAVAAKESAALWRDLKRDLIKDGARGGILFLLGLLAIGALAALAARLGIHK